MCPENDRCHWKDDREFRIRGADGRRKTGIVNLDFLRAPVDFQTAYFIVFGLAAVYASVMVALVRLDDRRRRIERHDARENRAHP